MIYESEAVLPTDIKFGSPRVECFDQLSADKTREVEINCTEEQRLDSYVRTPKYLNFLRRYYNRNVKERSIVVKRFGTEMEDKPGSDAQTIHALGGLLRGHESHMPHLLQIGPSGWHKLA